ncbi:MAG: hypothetical protein K1W33_00745 [Clostridia bacterium]|mgnify:CR=1 FL=1
MSLKKLEIKLQTIIENDELELDIKNIYTQLQDMYENVIMKAAQFNFSEFDVYSIKEDCLEFFSDRKEKFLLRFHCNCLENFLEERRQKTVQTGLDLIEEILVNQELYDLLVKELPHLEKIITYMNSNKRDYEIDNIISWFEDWLDCVQPFDIKEGLIFTTLDNQFKELYETDILPYIGDE